MANSEVDCTDDTCNGTTGECVFTDNCDKGEVCDPEEGCVEDK
jgi:hypothetical protein